MRVRVWRPFPDLRVRATHYDDGTYGLEIWRQVDPTTWAYQAILPDKQPEKKVEL